MSAIPLKIYITPFADKGVVEPEKWSRDAATRALNVVNGIWSKANGGRPRVLPMPRIRSPRPGG